MNQLLWVNDKDEVIGTGEKIYTHQIGQLHRAFSIFIYDPIHQKLLIQKRAMNKYHSAGKWSNSCCSHPYVHESIQESLVRCIYDELGVKVSKESIFKEVGIFHYFSNYGDLKEHEMDHVYIYEQDESFIHTLQINKEEVEEIKWVDLHILDDEFNSNPDDFSSWFSQAYEIVKSKL